MRKAIINPRLKIDRCIIAQSVDWFLCTYLLCVTIHFYSFLTLLKTYHNQYAFGLECAHVTNVIKRLSKVSPYELPSSQSDAIHVRSRGP